MKRKLIMAVVLAGMLTTVMLPASAHHSFFAEFDSTKTVELKGTILEMEWVNPHSWLHISVENEQGEIDVWKIEGGSPGVLLRLGWTRDSFPPGTEVIVTGFQAKDGSFRASSRGIEFPDGSVRGMGGTSR